MAEKNPTPKFFHFKERYYLWIILALIIIIAILMILVTQWIISTGLATILFGAFIFLSVHSYYRRPLPKDFPYVIKKIVEMERIKFNEPLDTREADSVPLPGDILAIAFPFKSAVYEYNLAKGAIISRRMDISMSDYLREKEEFKILGYVSKEEILKAKARQKLEQQGYVPTLPDEQ